MTNKIKLAILLVILLWSSAYVGIRVGLESYSPGGLALLRFLIASVTIFFIYSRRVKRSPIQWRDLFLALMTGAIGIGIYNITLNYGELVVSAGMASFIISQSPVITTILAVIFFRERITLYSIVGMMVSILGVGLIAAGRDSEFNFYVGIVYVLIAMFVGGLYSVLQKSLLQKYNVIDIAAYAIWGGTLILLMFIPDLYQDIQFASLSATLTVVYLGVFPAALAYLAWGFILSQIPASRAVSFLYFCPLVATLIEWIWLDEVPTLTAFAGGIIALLGVWLVNQAFSKKAIVMKDAASI